MSRRLERTAELIKRELGIIILKEIGEQCGLTTITRVILSRDIEYANIYFVSMPDSAGEKILKIFKENIFSIQQTLNSRLSMRPVPKVRFHIDRAEEEANMLDELLKRV